MADRSARVEALLGGELYTVYKKEKLWGSEAPAMDLKWAKELLAQRVQVPHGWLLGSKKGSKCLLRRYLDPLGRG